MGRIAKGVKCSVIGCEKPAVRSISTQIAGSAGLDVETGRRSYLCEEHYKEFKKRTKKEKMLEKWRWGT